MPKGKRGRSICKVETCTSYVVARGWCSVHYDAWRWHGDPLVRTKQPQKKRPPALKQMLAKIEMSGVDDCWPCRNKPGPGGYAMCSIDGEPDLAHRHAYRILIGPIPDGYDVDHLCHNRDRSCPGGVTCGHRHCCNPDHLEAVPHIINAQRGRTGEATGALYRAREKCVNGHEFTEENTYIYPDGSRTCRTCHRNYQQFGDRRGEAS